MKDSTHMLHLHNLITEDEWANTTNVTDVEAASSSSTTHTDSSQGAPPQSEILKVGGLVFAKNNMTNLNGWIIIGV